MSVEQRNNPKLLMGIMGALVTVVALVLLYQWLNASSGEAERIHQEDIAAVPAAKPAAKTEEDTAAAKAPETIEAKALVSNQLLDAPVPENASLVKEEVAKLDDIQVQLNEQKATLDAQHSDADQLVQLKEEQIKLLEAQLAQSQ
ncbi:hypothetical protein QUG64_10070 [Acinetobacter lwoffii]|jgi:hypothetical protein|uniref:Uncharacterized protein n=1 Tax=Acinetobacter lwoffii NCTC 5866 = CIP 64.10 = NIPH 512 TaxID=981327 RepID=A0ABP2ZH50_ACILW|nr:MULTISPECIES: hypothetical protein [Acinetobacter]ENU17908.1 hypothetical protein F995_00383 [Acinetobacter sp. CIP A162]ESJ94889.1 hypothetical protein P800_02996 [Acinetobacter lwoffii NCTC 5866 = CIP 64.10 = NIPH 512]MRA04232.1 hypothetical protein [Acinetobacter lwoffii]QXB39403.1 hypothetical protein I6L23_09080 [Acinetobacter lwoffii]UHT63723.1 hypothetical protein ABEDC_0459 [Acinetobacter lwoffii]